MHKTLTDLSFTKLLKLKINVSTWKNLFANSDTSTSTCNRTNSVYEANISILPNLRIKDDGVAAFRIRLTQHRTARERREECVKRSEKFVFNIKMS